ncbi:MAG: phage tail protein I [Acetobacter sp.]|nr:phage tail protein I [Acetobacter sp.]
MSVSDDIAATQAIAEGILPDNASPIERAVLCAEIARMALVDPGSIATIWNGDTCPSALLPWLARSVSVDVWDTSWTEAVRRSAVRNSPLIHRMKGTVWAVQRALSQYGISASLTEWWQDESIERGHIKVSIKYGSGTSSFNNDFQVLTLQSVRSAKPKSRPMDNTVTEISVAGSVFAGAATMARVTAIISFRES